MADILKEVLSNELKALVRMKPEKLIDRRIEKFSSMGVWSG
jgi:acetyl-CoA carboxylase alpha subunit